MEGTHFAKLPAEVRNRIYALIIGERSPKRTINIGKACQVNVTRVCKQMRAESLPMCFSNIGAHINVMSNVRWSFNFAHEKPSLDHHWGYCRGVLIKGASNIMATARRVNMHPQTCYDGLRLLKLNIILDAEDYGFALAWQVWEPHLQRLIKSLESRKLDSQRIRIRLVYHTLVEDEWIVGAKVVARFARVNRWPYELICVEDQDLVLKMDELREKWRRIKAEEADGNCRDSIRTSICHSILRMLLNIYPKPGPKARLIEEARCLQAKASERGEVIGSLDGEQVDVLWEGDACTCSLSRTFNIGRSQRIPTRSTHKRAAAT